MLSESELTGFRKNLEKERGVLEEELSRLGKRNPENPSDWVAGKPDGDEFGADRNDNADIIEDMEEDNATLAELEARLNGVNAALGKMDEGTYGICDVCSGDIELDRLKANPAATTCKKHMQ